jgi:hypothetical protein
LPIPVPYISWRLGGGGATGIRIEIYLLFWPYYLVSHWEWKSQQ